MNTSDISSSKEGLEKHYALQVALQTMKERCQNLQHRLTTVEDENLRLRMVSGIDKPDQQSGGRLGELGSKFSGQNEIELLRDKVAELTRQKVQLTEHIAMVATENRQLWSRLSKLTKDNHTLGSSLNKMKDSLSSSTTSNPQSSPTTGSANLVRSKTFTQNSPNPMIRPKINPSEFDEDENFNEENDDYSRLENTIGFGYLQDQELNDDSEQNAKRIKDTLKQFKKEMLWQQNDLKNILIKLRTIKDTKSQNEAINKIIKVDKCLETDPIEVESPPKSNTEHAEVSSKQLDDDKINNMKQKFIKEEIDKMCPMCGKLFNKQATFNEFHEHVEQHFIDDSEAELNSIERNFEIIQHTVGDF